MITPIEDVVERTLANAGEGAAALADDMLGPDAADAVKDTTRRVVRQLRHGAQRASDVMGETALCIRRQPLKAVTVTFMGGLIAGVLAASTLMAARRA